MRATRAIPCSAASLAGLRDCPIGLGLMYASGLDAQLIEPLTLALRPLQVASWSDFEAYVGGAEPAPPHRRRQI